MIVAILTDGLENSSQDYTWQQIADVIKQQSEQYRWTFLFLGANQDAIATAAQMNITAANAAAYTSPTLPGCMLPPVLSRAKCEPCAGSAWGQRAWRNATMRLHRCPASSPRKTRKNATDKARADDVSIGTVARSRFS